MRFLPAGIAMFSVCLSITAAEPVPLFDGKTLDGWTGLAKPNKDGTIDDWKKTWSVKNGELHCTGKPNGYIATAKEFADYTLKLKWKYPADAKAGNGGVLLHVQKDRYWPHCVEAQLKAGQAGDFWLQPDETGQLPKIAIDPERFDKDGKDNRHYFRIGKTDTVEKPFGEWNEYEITCRGGDITLTINGKKVNEGKGCSLVKGRIGLQSEGSEIAFKDIVLTPLK